MRSPCRLTGALEKEPAKIILECPVLWPETVSNNCFESDLWSMLQGRRGLSDNSSTAVP